MEDKTLLITIKPQHLCNILNGIKTIEVRKNKNLANAVKKLIAENGECRIKCVCSKSKPYLYPVWTDNGVPGDCCMANKYEEWIDHYETANKESEWGKILNGYVVCEIVVDSVDDIVMGYCPRTRNMPREDREEEFQTIDFEEKELCKRACLAEEEFHNYLEDKIEKSNDWWNEIFGYALHIKTVTPYEKPKEIGDLMKPHTIFDIAKVKCKNKERGMCNRGLSLKTGKWIGCNKFRLTKAPQNFCYVEEK